MTTPIVTPPIPTPCIMNNLLTLVIDGDKLFLKSDNFPDFDTLTLVIGRNRLYFNSFVYFKKQATGTVKIEVNDDVVLCVENNVVDGCLLLYENLTKIEIECIRLFYSLLGDNSGFTDLTDTVIIYELNNVPTVVELQELTSEQFLGLTTYTIKIGGCSYILKIENDSLILKLPKEIVCLIEKGIFTELELQIGTNLLFDCYPPSRFPTQETGSIKKEIPNVCTLHLAEDELVPFISDASCIPLFTNLTKRQISKIKCFYTNDYFLNTDIIFHFNYPIGNTITATLNDFCSELYKTKTTHTIDEEKTKQFKLIIEDGEFKICMCEFILSDPGLNYIKLLIGKDHKFFNCCEEFRDNDIGMIIDDSGDMFIKVDFPNGVVTGSCVTLYSNLTDEEIGCMKCFYSEDTFALDDIIFTFDVLGKVIEEKIGDFCSEDYNDNCEILKQTYILGGTLNPRYHFEITSSGVNCWKLTLFVWECLLEEELDCLEVIIGNNGKIFNCYEILDRCDNGDIQKAVTGDCVTDEDIIYIKLTSGELNSEVVLYDKLSKHQVDAIKCYYINDIDILNVKYVCDEEVINSSQFCYQQVKEDRCYVLQEDPAPIYELKIEGDKLILKVPPEYIDTDLEEMSLIVGTSNKLFNCQTFFTNHLIGFIITQNIDEMKLTIIQDDLSNNSLSNTEKADLLNGCITLFANLTEEQIRCIRCFYTKSVLHCNVLFYNTCITSLTATLDDFCNDTSTAICCDNEISFTTSNVITDDFTLLLKNDSLQLCLPEFILNEIKEGDFETVQLLIGTNFLYFGCCEVFSQIETGFIFIDVNGNIYVRIKFGEIDGNEPCITLFNNMSEENLKCIKCFYSSDFFVDSAIILEYFYKSCKKLDVPLSRFKDEFYKSKVTHTIDENSLCKYELSFTDSGDLQLKVPFDDFEEILLKIGEDNKYFNNYDDFDIQKVGTILTFPNGDKFLQIKKGDVVIVDGCITIYEDLGENEIISIKCFYSIGDVLSGFKCVTDEVIKYTDECKTNIIPLGDFCNENFRNKTSYTIGGLGSCSFTLQIINGELHLLLPDGIVDEFLIDLKLTIGNEDKFFGCYDSFRQSLTGVSSFNLNLERCIIISKEEASQDILLYDNLTKSEIDCIKCFYNDDLETILTINKTHPVKGFVVTTNVNIEQFCKENFELCCDEVCEVKESFIIDDSDNCVYEIIIEDDELYIRTPQYLENVIKMELLISTDGALFNCCHLFSGTKETNTIQYSDKKQTIEIFETGKTLLFTGLSESDIRCIRCFYTCGILSKNTVILNIVTNNEVQQIEEITDIKLKDFCYDKEKVVCNIGYVTSYTILKETVCQYELKIDGNKLVLSIPFENDIKNLSLIVGKDDLLFGCTNSFNCQEVGVIVSDVDDNKVLQIQDIKIENLTDCEIVLFKDLSFEQINIIKNFYRTKCDGGFFNKCDIILTLQEDIPIGEQIKCNKLISNRPCQFICSDNICIQNGTSEGVHEIPLSDFCYERYMKKITYVVGGPAQFNYELKIECDELILEVPAETVDDDFKYMELVIGKNGKFFNSEKCINRNLGIPVNKKDCIVLVITNGHVEQGTTHISIISNLSNCDKEIISDFYSKCVFKKTDIILKVVKKDCLEVSDIPFCELPLQNNVVDDCKSELKLTDDKLTLIVPGNLINNECVHIELKVGCNDKLFNCNCVFPTPSIGYFYNVEKSIQLVIDTVVNKKLKYINIPLFCNLTPEQVKTIRNYYSSKYSCSADCVVLTIDDNSSKTIEVKLNELCDDICHNECGNYNNGILRKSFTTGDPHITPLFGKTYSLPHDEQIYKYFDNLDKDERIVINCKLWMPSEKELVKSPYIKWWMFESSYLKYISIIYKTKDIYENVIIDMENLEINANTKHINVDDTKYNSKGIYSIVNKKYMKNKTSKYRNVSIKSRKHGNIKIKLLNDISIPDVRSSIEFEISNITENNACGCVIKESHCERVDNLQYINTTLTINENSVDCEENLEESKRYKTILMNNFLKKYKTRKRMR